MKNGDGLKYEDEFKIEDDIENEDKLTIKMTLKRNDMHHNEDKQKNEDCPAKESTCISCCRKARCPAWQGTSPPLEDDGNSLALSGTSACRERIDQDGYIVEDKERGEFLQYRKYEQQQFVRYFI